MENSIRREKYSERFDNGLSIQENMRTWGKRFILEGVIKIPYNILLSFQSEKKYLEEKILEEFEKEIKERNLNRDSLKIINEELLETAVQSIDKQIAYRIIYNAVERNEDDEMRERIEFMIQNL